MADVDPFHLDRFVRAQAPVIVTVRAELLRGRKQSHWMWFVFPQIAGLGGSDMARRYAIGSLAEARAYLAHPVLGPRLAELTRIVLSHAGQSAQAIFGGIDAVKFRSSLTLFEAAGGDGVFAQALNAFFGCERDQATLARLAGERPASVRTDS